LRYLVDTHILIWAVTGSERLGAPAVKALEDPGNTISFSTVSAWEMGIKFGLGKLNLGGHSPAEAVAKAELSGMIPSAPDARMCASVHLLPYRHRDPFDRLLVWQAVNTGMTLLSAESRLADYRQDGLSLITT
jgi:PIN domain nuclease of toxin-antitoxin system